MPRGIYCNILIYEIHLIKRLSNSETDFYNVIKLYFLYTY